MNKSILLFALSLTACMERGGTRVALSPGALPSPNLVQLRADPFTESFFGLPHGALTSEATLVRADADATCVDVLFRGDYERRAAVALDVDGVTSAWQKATLSECRVDGPCLPADTHLGRYASDVDPKVAPEGARMCFEHVPVARRALSLRVKQGALERRFDFHVEEPRLANAR